MSLRLTPGVKFILAALPKLTLPGAIVYLVAHHLSYARWVCVLGSMAAWPLLSLVHAQLRHMAEEREIRALGAVRVPEVKGKWPWNLDLVVGRLKQGKDGYPFDAVEVMTRQYGETFNMCIFGENRVVTQNPTHIQKMYATDFEGWEKGDRFRWQFASLGLGVFVSDGSMWRFHRQMMRPFFSRDRITDLDNFSRHCENALDVLRASDGVPIDFQDVAFRFTLDAAAEFLCGVRINSLHGDENSQTFGPAMSSLQHQLAQRSRMAPLWPFFEIKRDKTRVYLDAIQNFFRPIIQAALEKKVANDGNAAPSDTLLDELLEKTSDPQLILDQTMNVLFAGRDTTAATITFLTYCLATHPPVLARVRAEIAAQLGDLRSPTFEDIKELKLLRATINETLRLFPPVPGNVRSAIRSTTLPSNIQGGKPYYIPAGTKVPFSTMTMHKSKKFWGDDADNWDPDRFLDERNQRVVSNPFIFLPFSAGPRICLGQQFAYQEISFFIVRLLQTFQSIELAPEAQPEDSRPPAAWANGPGRKKLEKIKPKSDLTMSVAGGLWLTVKT
ncbi:Cytochrome P450 monooxygenase [Mycena indigotica]|uniref:Cytochrome P450 monooxygenase n=1 Tax=Mycena indigotica TaxID=2126181 RepID=A0A8H6T735_9AGAR|nr:Cytochrome P450 monooxygenase [Mycena indigotica]KAF7312278.1 Cytochrome P450 monooxygenase [Mycena indigotica]